MSNTLESNFKIIIIDDNPSIHCDFIKILRTERIAEIDKARLELFGKDQAKEIPTLPLFEIDVASQGQEGVEKIKEALAASKPYALAFVDIRMPPGWDGIETIKHIWALDKNIQIVICTAYSDYSWEETVSCLGKTDNLLILKKPFDNISIRQLALSLTTKWKLAEETRRYTIQLEKQVTDRTVSLQKSLSIVKSTFESSNDGIIVIDSEGTIVDYNKNLLTMLDIPSSVLFTKREEDLLLHIQNQLTNPNEFISIIEKLRENSDESSIDVLHLKNGKILECYTQPHKLDEKIIGRVLDFRDITARANLEQELKFQATHDNLTGLANRIQLREKIKNTITTTDLNHSTFAVLFLDLDRFKLINDSFSHQVGDELLKQVAKRLEESIQPDDGLARIGGDEFVIILTNIKNKNDLEEKVNKILSAFQNPFDLTHRQLVVTTSVGISLYPQDGKSGDILLRNADSAMYKSKSKKGNNFTFYSSDMNEESIAALDQESELRQAIANNELFLVYQPQFDLVKQTIIAVEALVRWQHPTKGVLLPVDFVPLAEETGLIVPIGEWILKKACEQNKAWQNEGLFPIRIAVNITAQQFKQQDLVNVIREILQKTQLNPKYLEIELTENVILSNSEVINKVAEIKKLGVMIAVDDFGTGYSSLGFLHKIPLDRLKIDSSFIKHIQAENDDEVIIRAIIAMAKNLNLEVLAEGVETREQLNFLKKYECDDIQGCYFSTPLNAEKITNYLANPETIQIPNKIISKDS